MSAVDAIDNAPLFKMLTEVVMKGPGQVLAAAGTTFSEIGSAVGNLASSSIRSIAPSGQEPLRETSSNAPAPEVAPHKDDFTVGLDNLMNLSPSIGNKGVKQAPLDIVVPGGH